MAVTLDAIANQIKEGKLDQARQALQATEKRSENDAEIFFLRGSLAEAEFDTARAYDAFCKAIERSPDHPEALFRAGWLADQCGNETDAIEFYRRCTTGDPAPVNALINLAVLYEESGMLAEAEACLKNVLKGDPNHFRARHFLKSVECGYTMVYDERGLKEREQRSAIMDQPITDFELSVRSRNCLRQMNIRSIGDLLRSSEAELMAYKNFGETSLNEIKALLGSKGLSLGQAAPPTAAPPAPVAAPKATPEVAPHSHRPVTDLELSVRSRKALQRLGVSTIGDLTIRTEAELMAIKNFGLTSLNEIKRQLAQMGFTLRQPA